MKSIMKNCVFKVHPADNVIVALRDLGKGEVVTWDEIEHTLIENIAAKHKFAERPFETGDRIVMYGVLVGKAQRAIPAGARISTENVKHASMGFELKERKIDWHIPDVSGFVDRTFMGFARSDGSVGTANHWLVIPLVFCENRNVEVMKESLVNELGFARPKKYNRFTRQLSQLYASGSTVQQILDVEFF